MLGDLLNLARAEERSFEKDMIKRKKSSWSVCFGLKYLPASRCMEFASEKASGYGFDLKACRGS